MELGLESVQTGVGYDRLRRLVDCVALTKCQCPREIVGKGNVTCGSPWTGNRRGWKVKQLLLRRDERLHNWWIDAVDARVVRHMLARAAYENERGGLEEPLAMYLLCEGSGCL